MYSNVENLIRCAKEQKLSLWQVILENECRLTEKTEEEVFQQLDKRYEVMLCSVNKALKEPQQTVGNLITGMAHRQYLYSKKEDSLCGPELNRMMAMALSASEVNAAMGKICAAPTAGSCGILPAVLAGVSEKYHLDRKTTLKGLLTASGIGTIIVKNATVSGAEGGCQAECGVAAAMAAAAAVEMRGGTPDMAANAVSFAFMNCMGLVCDPIAGLVQLPCAQRNASQAVNALLSADLALAGTEALIPTDEVIEAMYKVGKKLPYELKETALGGIAATPAGKHIEERIFASASNEAVAKN